MNPHNLIPAPYRWIAWLAGVVLLIIVVMFIGARLGSSLSDPFGIGAANRAHDRAAARTAPHAKAASDSAAEAKAGFDARQEGRDKLTKENSDDILSQPDAGADAGDTGRALLRSLCRRQPDNVRCRPGLRGEGPAQP